KKNFQEKIEKIPWTKFSAVILLKLILENRVSSRADDGCSRVTYAVFENPFLALVFLPKIRLTYKKCGPTPEIQNREIQAPPRVPGYYSKMPSIRFVMVGLLIEVKANFLAIVTIKGRTLVLM
ncbi:unnamed protein product, partial [Nesidiocoris tenuis]